jgi:hypothetical protein
MTIAAVRTLVLIEAAMFALASLVHGGHLAPGYDHRNARIAEAVIAVVLSLGLVASVVWPSQARRAALVAQAFALLGTLVGLFTIAVGVGPRTVPDVVYHVLIVALLAYGVAATRRSAVA